MKISSISINESLHHISSRSIWQSITFKIYWLKITRINYYSWRSCRCTSISHPLILITYNGYYGKQHESHETQLLKHGILHEWRKCLVARVCSTKLHRRFNALCRITRTKFENSANYPWATCLLDNYAEQRGQSWQLECPHASFYITKNFDHNDKRLK